MVYFYLCVCIHAHVRTDILKSKTSKEGVRTVENGVISDCKPPNVGVGNWTPVLYKNSKLPNHSVITSASLLPFWFSAQSGGGGIDCHMWMNKTSFRLFAPSFDFFLLWLKISLDQNLFRLSMCLVEVSLWSPAGAIKHWGALLFEPFLPLHIEENTKFS